MTNLIEKYVPKYAQDLVLELDKDFDGYDLILVDGYYFTDTETTMRIEETVADLKKVFKFIAKIEDEETVETAEETVEAVESVETTPAVEAVESFETTESRFYVELIHDDEYIGCFEMDHICELEGIAQYHATQYIAGDEVIYQIFLSDTGSHVGDVFYSFEDDKAIKFR